MISVFGILLNDNESDGQKVTHTLWPNISLMRPPPAFHPLLAIIILPNQGSLKIIVFILRALIGPRDYISRKQRAQPKIVKDNQPPTASLYHPMKVLR